MTKLGGFIYDFQTLLTGILAIVVAIFAGVPVWRQLKDTNLQTRISHRETLATLLRDALQRIAEVDKALRKPLTEGLRITDEPSGEPNEIDPHAAHYLHGMLNGVLDWYLVVLADTESADIELRKKALKDALEKATDTLSLAYWTDSNDQTGEDYSLSDDAWADMVAKCAQAKLDASDRLIEVSVAYRALGEVQQKWVRSLRTQIAKLDQQIATSS